MGTGYTRKTYAPGAQVIVENIFGCALHVHLVACSFGGMGFFSKLIGATVKRVLTPIAVVKDAVSVVQGESPEATKELVDEAVQDVKEAAEDLGDDNL